MRIIKETGSWENKCSPPDQTSNKLYSPKYLRMLGVDERHMCCYWPQSHLVPLFNTYIILNMLIHLSELHSLSL